MINTVYIKHNPYTIETEFLFNGEKPPLNIGFLELWEKQHLQLWVEQLFGNLSRLFNHASNFHVIFEGVEADYLDVLTAANEARPYLDITLEWKKAKESAERLLEIQKLMKEAERNPLFGRYIKNNIDIQQDFKEVFNKDFDVYVVATMSAGKSTLINAMLGTDLLPAANEATTATIAQITDNDSMEKGVFVGRRISKEKNILDDRDEVTLATLQDWNGQHDTHLIQLEGDIVGVSERENVRLVITDTPGPNNSQDEEHKRTTMGYIQNTKRNPLILYILNATQLGTDDDKRVLQLIVEQMSKGGKQSKDRFIFVVNKMDTFDPESGENIENALERVKKYLVENRVENPMIYPISANLTRLLRKESLNPDSLTRKERGDLASMKDLFIEEPTMDLVQYMPLSQSTKRNLLQKNLPTALYRSGLPAIESMIDEYIDKYNLPHRVNRAYTALYQALELSVNENQLTADLNDAINQSEQIAKQLNELSIHKKNGISAKVNIEKKIQKGKGKILYPKNEMDELAKIQTNVRRKINNEFQNDFFGEVTQKEAKRKLKALTKSVNHESNVVINKLDMLIDSAQEFTEQQLRYLFNDYVQDLFESLNNDIPMPVLEGLKNQVESIAGMSGLGLRNGDVDTRIEIETVTRTKTVMEWGVIGTKQVSDSRWYNPFSWGSKKTVDVYGDIEKEITYQEDVEKTVEFVDLDAVWDEREFEITNHFNELIRAAEEKIAADTEKYAQTFLEFLDKEFEKELKKITDELKSKLANKTELESKAKEAKKQLVKIQQFKDKINQVLEV